MVEIKVDTKRDSKEEIKKVIEFLQRFVQESSLNQDMPVENVSEGAFNIFNQETTYQDNKDDDDSDDDSDLEIKPMFY